MKEVISFIISFFTEHQEGQVIKLPVLVISFVVLFIALWICIAVSRKNRLYIRPKKKDKDQELLREKEVTT